MPSPAASLFCLEIDIADGDTLNARCKTLSGVDNLRVRLAEIDAPEKGQAFGNRNRQHLAEVYFRKRAVAKPPTTDRYGRTVVRFECDSVDANVEQVRLGIAWVFACQVTDRGRMPC